MRIKEHIAEMLQKRARKSAEIAGCLLEYPNCLDGDSQKETAYQVAIQYFTEKQKCSKTISGQVSCNNRVAIELAILLDCYEQQTQEAKKQEYARKIARNLIDTQEYFLMRVPDEIKKEAFQITIQYLEEQKNA